MMTTQVLVRLKSADPWSFTVLDTLRRKFGLGQITGVDRIKCWDIAFDHADVGAAMKATSAVLRETALLANPNRDRWVLREGTDRQVPADFWHLKDRTSQVFAVKVHNREDIVGRSVTGILQRRLGMGEIESVRFSTIWVLEISGDEPDAEGLARRVATVSSWRNGLLANPHCQDAEICAAGDHLRTGEGTA
jgi:phosphoribosylformylglycinamidine (FGAM) synthase PurS component